MPIAKITAGQRAKLMNSPVHYECGGGRFDPKSGFWEIECDGGTLKKIKEVVDEPKPKNK